MRLLLQMSRSWRHSSIRSCHHEAGVKQRPATNHGAEKVKQMKALKEERKKEMQERQRKNLEKKKEKTAITYNIPTEPGEKKDTSVPLPKAYNPAYVEAAWYEWWHQSRFFQPKANKYCAKDDRYVVCLPPPNITGSLHLGHALGNSIQDALVRWHRMLGHDTLWVPGTDHAGIATQVVVEKKLWQESRKTRHNIGREKFIEEVWKWKQEKGNRINEQMKRLGSSLDWSRAVFTLDDNLSHAVNEAFVRLHEEGLIYRHTRLVNWSCALNSAISDIEVEGVSLEKKTYLPVPGYDKPVAFGVMTSFAYPVLGLDEKLVVATTRPETMLGDVAVAVHPEDTRYSHLHGLHLQHPFCERHLSVITDTAVDMDFGTGAVKITPAHDQTDWEIGMRHNLESISVIDEAGKMINVPPMFMGMRRFDARHRVLEELKEKGLLEHSQANPMTVPICSRSGDVVEPLLKPQWFLNCNSMAEQAIQAVENGNLKLVPSTFEKIWFDWLHNIRDWCISRQLWWGHRVPAYKVYHKGQQVMHSGSEMWVSGHSEQEVLQKASQLLHISADELTVSQDEDVLDTWFSSALFPFSALGWPNKTSDFDRFYPGDLLETSHDILFFWVARMVMMGVHLTGQLPFKQVLLHGILRDSSGRKMSKSLGNVVDPMDVIEGITLKELHAKLDESNLSADEKKKAKMGQKVDLPHGIQQCGADALRFTLCSYDYQAHFVNVNVAHIESNHNFCNKIWQAFRYCTPHWDGRYDLATPSEEQLSTLPATDAWILSRLSNVVSSCHQAFSSQTLNKATLALHTFWKLEFCDTYLEYSKGVFAGGDVTRKQLTAWILHGCVDTGLRCLAPFMPYLTEELYQRLPDRQNCLKHTSVCVAPYPNPCKYPWANGSVDRQMDYVQSVITSLLSLQKLLHMKKTRPSVLLEVHSVESNAALCDHLEAVRMLTRTPELAVTMTTPDDLSAHWVALEITGSTTAHINLAGVDRRTVLPALQARKLQVEADLNKLLTATDLDKEAVNHKKSSLDLEHTRLSTLLTALEGL